MAKPKTVDAYFASLEGSPRDIANALRSRIEESWPELSVKLAWGFPCYSGNERVASIIAHKERCNLQLWSGARLAEDFPDVIEGTGKALRHIKVTSVKMVDLVVKDVIEAAVELDRTDPQKVR